MGGFRTVFGGFVCIGAGILAIVVGLLSPAALSLPSEHFLAGYFFARWSEALTYTSTQPLFGWVWLVGIIIWIISAILLTLGGFIGFWKGGYGPLIGALLFFIFDIVVNLTAASVGITPYALGGIVHSVSILVLISGLFGGILQASASQ
ncbi:MAG: hypothetical protein ACTSPY_08490 [Candidatus Helarchaeota archaeon]